MIYCCCTEKIRDKNGKITEYVLQDTLGGVMRVDGKTLKNYLINNQLEINNLKLSLDGRIIDKKLELSLAEMREQELNNIKSNIKDTERTKKQEELIKLYEKHFSKTDYDRQYNINFEDEYDDLIRAYQLISELYGIKFRKLNGYGGLNKDRNPIMLCGKTICIPCGYYGILLPTVDPNRIRRYYPDYATDIKWMYGIELSTGQEFTSRPHILKRLDAVVKFLNEVENTEGTELFDLLTSTYRIVRKMFNNTAFGCKFETKLINDYCTFELTVSTVVKDSTINIIKIYVQYDFDEHQYKVLTSTLNEMMWKTHINPMHCKVVYNSYHKDFKFNCRECINLKQYEIEIRDLYRKAIVNYNRDKLEVIKQSRQ